MTVELGQVMYDDGSHQVVAFVGMSSEETAVVVCTDGSLASTTFTNLHRLYDNHGHEYQGMAVAHKVDWHTNLPEVVTAVRRARHLFVSELLTTIVPQPVFTHAGWTSSLKPGEVEWQ